MKRLYFNPKKEYTIINTIDGYDLNDEWLKEFKMYCEDMGYEFVDGDNPIAMEDGSKVTDYEAWVRESQENDIDDFWANLRSGKDDSHVIVTGHFDSRYPDFYGPNPARVLAINPVDSLEEAIKKCFKCVDYASVKVKDNVIYVKGIHHDGTEYYEIRVVAKSAWDKINNGNYKTDEEILSNNKNFIRPYWNMFGLA